MKLALVTLLVGLVSPILALGDRGNTLRDCFPEKTCANCRRYYSKYSFRTIDGTCNNLHYKTRGAAFTKLSRFTEALYADRRGLDTPRGFPGTSTFHSTPTPHEVSKAIFTKGLQNKKNQKSLSVLFMTFGQFLDHDIGETPHNNMQCRRQNKDCHSISAYNYPCIPIKFNRHTSKCTGFGRSKAVCQTGGHRRTRELINKLSSYLDLSMVYSNDFKHHQKLRRLDGSGKLKVNAADLLPIEHPSSDSRCDNPAGCSLVGDDRGDENIALNAMHTIWVRNHNYIADQLKIVNPWWDERLLFEYSRKINIGIFQNIVYNEWLPTLIHLPKYQGYDKEVDASIMNEFSAAAFRFGHSLIPNSWAYLDRNFDPIEDPIPLQNTFGNTEKIRVDGIENLVYGLCANQSQEVDSSFADGIMTKLFVKPGERIHRDLTALNIMRGRDHGLPTYGRIRERCGLKKLTSFADLEGIMERKMIKRMQKIYKHPNYIDLFAAGISEKHKNGKIIGETFQCIIQEQFKRLRDGDRYFYKNVFTSFQQRELSKMSIGRVLCDNLKGVVSMQLKSFQTAAAGQKRIECSYFPKINFKAWTLRRPYSRQAYHSKPRVVHDEFEYEE